MGTNLHVNKWPFFLFDHRIFQTWDFDMFLAKVPEFWCGGSPKWSVKKVEKNSKNRQKIFSLKMFLMCFNASRVVLKSSPNPEESFLTIFDHLGLITIFLSDVYCQCGNHHWVSKKSKKSWKIFCSKLIEEWVLLEEWWPLRSFRHA